jgi:hypothetical protein
MTESHEKFTFFNDASWKLYFSAKVGVLIALNSKPYRFSKLVVMVLSYVPGKCTTVIVVHWAKIGRSMNDRKFRVHSSLFRSLWLRSHFICCGPFSQVAFYGVMETINYAYRERFGCKITKTYVQGIQNIFIHKLHELKCD